MPDGMLGGEKAQTKADKQGDLVLKEPPKLCASHNSNNVVRAPAYGTTDQSLFQLDRSPLLLITGFVTEFLYHPSSPLPPMDYVYIKIQDDFALSDWPRQSPKAQESHLES